MSFRRIVRRRPRKAGVPGCLAFAALAAISCSSAVNDAANADSIRSSPSAAASTTPGAAVPAASATSAAAPAETPAAERWNELVPRIQSPDLVDRFLEASGLLLGIPYANGPLGEGDPGGIDPDPRADLRRADCVTFLEESLALALAAPRRAGDYLGILDAIRYEGAEVGFAARNHYMMRDWVPANAWLVDDVTSIVGAGKTRTIRKTIDRAAFLREQGAAPRPGVDGAGTIEFAAIPTAELAAVGDRLRSGDLLLWVAKKDGIDIAHTGMVVRDPKNGSPLHRHASSKAAKALDEPLFDYAKRATFADGVVVLRLKPEAAPAGLPGDE